MQHFRFEIIGGTAFDGRTTSASEATPDDVRREARRRLKAAGYDVMRAREMGTGIRMPKAMTYLHMQIEFVAASLSTLPVIPANFRSDIYWPRNPSP